jgi:hypothetical protein
MLSPVRSSGLNVFNAGAPFFKKDSVSAVGAADVEVDLYLLFAPGALVPSHSDLHLPGNGTVNRAERYFQGRSLRSIGTTGKLETAFGALPDTGALPGNLLAVATRADMTRAGYFLDFIDPFSDKATVSGAIPT